MIMPTHSGRINTRIRDTRSQEFQRNPHRGAVHARVEGTEPASTCTSRSAYSAKHEIVLKSSEGKFYRSSSFCRLRL